MNLCSYVDHLMDSLVGTSYFGGLSVLLVGCRDGMERRGYWLNGRIFESSFPAEWEKMKTNQASESLIAGSGNF